MSEHKNRSPVEEQEILRKRTYIVVGVVLVAALIMLYVSHLSNAGDRTATALYEEKASLLEAEVMRQIDEWGVLTEAPTDAGHVVFLSLCDGTTRASVFGGTGDTLQAAWDAADKAAKQAAKDGLSATWLKADVVSLSEAASMAELYARLSDTRQEFFRYGVAFDADFKLALTEAELNSNKIYVYDEGGIDFDYLNNYLKKSNRDMLPALPEEITLFQSYGWLCDEDLQIHTLATDELDYGRRQVDTIDQPFVEKLILDASDYLVSQVKDDGSFIYGYYPRFDNEIDNYNILRHAGTIWSLICRYRMVPDDALAETIERTIDYSISQLLYDGADTAYLYEAKADEIKLGGNGVAIIGMTEYMDVFGSDRYTEICEQLGNGILNMLDQETGEYYHVLNGDFSRKEAYRTVYYDGEATFALCRLYSLTGDETWLNAAKSAVNHFIAADYTQYRDHWVAYSMNEITKHVDDPAYYTFALENAQKNLNEIYYRDTTYHTYLELLMVTFETYERMIERGIDVPYLAEFDLDFFLATIRARADRMLNGYFFPEVAMYMENPARILNAFMVRHDGYRTRIDDVQHNIGAFYLYYKNYDALLQYGMQP